MAVGPVREILDVPLCLCALCLEFMPLAQSQAYLSLTDEGGGGQRKKQELLCIGDQPACLNRKVDAHVGSMDRQGWCDDEYDEENDRYVWGRNRNRKEHASKSSPKQVDGVILT